MDKITSNYTTIDEYISQFEPDMQEILQTLRKVIKNAAPESEETISYQMPAFALHGVLVYFAARKNHIGFYPTSNPINEFKDELKKYKCSKGAIQFPIKEVLPYDLITRIVEFRVNENIQKFRLKQIKK